MKHPPLLPTIFMVVALGFLHALQKSGAPLPSPAKDLVVVVGLVLFGAAIVFARSSRHESQELDDVVPAPSDEKRASSSEYDLSA